MTYEDAKAALEALGFRCLNNTAGSYQFPGVKAMGFAIDGNRQAVIYETPKDHPRIDEILEANEWAVERWIQLTMSHCS